MAKERHSSVWSSVWRRNWSDIQPIAVLVVDILFCFVCVFVVVICISILCVLREYVNRLK